MYAVCDFIELHGMIIVCAPVCHWTTRPVKMGTPLCLRLSQFSSVLCKKQEEHITSLWSRCQDQK